MGRGCEWLDAVDLEGSARNRFLHRRQHCVGVSLESEGQGRISRSSRPGHSDRILHCVPEKNINIK